MASGPSSALFPSQPDRNSRGVRGTCIPRTPRPPAQRLSLIVLVAEVFEDTFVVSPGTNVAFTLIAFES